MNASVVVPLVLLVSLVALVVALIAIRQRALRRLAVRSALRRPNEAILVVLGSMLGTAIITGSFIVGDTLGASVRSSAWTQLGPIDETVTVYGLEAYPILNPVLSPLAGDPRIDGLAYAMVSSGTVAARYGADDPFAKPNVTLLELNFDAARTFGLDQSATGLGNVPTPNENEVVLSRDLAEDLRAQTGEVVDLFAYGGRYSLRVSAILPRVGIAGYASGPSSFSFNAFLAPGSIVRMAASAPPGQRPPPIVLGFVSNRGGVIEGRDLTDEVVTLLERQLEGAQGFRVTPAKDALLTQADVVGEQFASIFLSIGSFAVIAGVLLLVNIFVMLAEERKGELGMMRAVGMRRAQLVRAFLIEGSLYAGVAAVLGVAAGIGVGAAIVQVSSSLFTRQEAFALELRFSPSITSIIGGFALGLLISAATVFATSLRISRINVIRAIRDLPEPTRAGMRLRTLILGSLAALVGVAWLAGSISAKGPYGTLAAPGVIALGVVPLVARFVPTRPVVTVIGLALVAWGIAAASVLPDVFVETTTNLYVVQGVLITFAAVAVLSQNQELVSRGVRAMSGGSRNLAIRLGLAYPLARRFRTGMTLVMYSLVVFTLVFISILSGVFGRQVDLFTEQERGGYDLLVQSSAGNPLPQRALAQRPGIDRIAPLRYVFGAEFRPPGWNEFRAWPISGFDQGFIDGGPPDLEGWMPAYADEDEVWRAVLRDPTLMIVEPTFLQEGGPPARVVELGDVVEIRDPLSGVVGERRIVAQAMGGWAHSGPFVSGESLEQVFGPRAARTRAYVAVDGSTNADALAARLEADLIRYGVRAETFRSIVEEGEQVSLGFFRLMEGYLALGLLVGVSGLGVIMVRAVRERRRQVGMLRSLGFQPGTVGRAFLFESSFVAVEGILIGVTLAVATAYQLVTQADVFGDFEVTFAVPWLEIAVLSALTLVASIAATAWPARRASRIRPAAALRIAD